MKKMKRIVRIFWVRVISVVLWAFVAFPLSSQAQTKAELVEKQQAQRDSIQQMQQRITATEERIQAFKDSLQSLNSIYGELEKRNQELLEIIAKENRIESQIAQKEAELDKVCKEIENAWETAVETPPLALDTALVQRAIHSFDKNHQLLDMLGSDRAAPLHSTAEALPAYLKLADLCHQAVALMKQPMKEAANVALCEQLTNVLGRCSSLSVASRDEAQGIIDALSQQKQVRDELVAFLDKIPDEMVCLGTEDLRAELMKTRLFTDDYKEFLKGGRLYNPYYEAINLAVKKVYDDLKENGDEKIDNLQTEDLFKAYFRELKKKF